MTQEQDTQAHIDRLNGADSLDRVRLALTCRDGDVIPKVENAGGYIDENGVAIQLMHNGIKVIKDCYYGPYMTQTIHFLRGVHEPQEEKCFHEILRHIKPNSKMLELGCYWGYYSLWFWKAIDGAECHLIELDNILLDVAIRNFELNGAKGIFTNAGVGRPNLKPWLADRVGNNIRAMPNGQIFFRTKHPVQGFHRNIPLITVDQYLRDNEIEHLALLHSDVQGEELFMLDGAEQALRQKNIGFIVISTHHNDQFHESVLEKVLSADYEVLAEHNVSDSYSGDGLVVAKHKGQPGPSKIEISRRRDSIF